MKLMTTQRLNLKSMLQKRTAHPTCTPAPHALLWHHEATPPLYPPFPRKLLWIQPKPSIITERRRLPKNNKIRQPHNPRVLSDPPFRPCVSTRDHDPTTHETVSQPSHRRGRSSRFGDGLCMEKQARKMANLRQNTQSGKHKWLRTRRLRGHMQGPFTLKR